jgi:hypothetical protein
MGTHSITLIRERKPKKKEMSVLGGPAESQYFYEYYVCIYQHFDGYIEGGVGEWLAEFLYKFKQNLSTLSNFVDAGLLGAKLIKAFYSSEFKNPRLIPITNIFQSDYEYAYIITVSCDSNLGLNDNSIMLSAYRYEDHILTARPEKFLKSFAENNYGDDEVEKNGYLLEDQLLIKFLNSA